MHIKHMHEMIEKLTDCTKSAIENDQLCVGKYPISDVVDMIKDLNEASYYASIVKAMDEAKKEDEEEEKYMMKMLKEEYKDDYKRMADKYGEGEETDRRFYDSWRHADGSFAKKGTGEYRPRSYYRRGSRRGYIEPPYYHVTPDMTEHDPEYWRDVDREKGRLYYTPMNTSGIMNNADGKTYSDGVNEGTRRGYSDGYEKGMADGKRSGENSRYEKAKRGYQETKEAHKGNTPEDKRMNMNEFEKVLNIVLDEIDDMLEDAPPEMKNMAKTKGIARLQKIS